MEKLDKCYSIVQQSGVKGLRTTEIAKKLGMHRSTAYKHLNSLELMGKIENKHGIWYSKAEEQTIKPLEKEIVIELPMPKDKWYDIALLEAYTAHLEDVGFQEVANITRTFLEKFNETRIVKIKGKNVDDLDLEKIANMIQQANEKSSSVKWKRLSKILKKALP
jgi:AcrR family transcriptional regulator